MYGSFVGRSDLVITSPDFLYSFFAISKNLGIHSNNTLTKLFLFVELNNDNAMASFEVDTVPQMETA